MHQRKRIIFVGVDTYQSSFSFGRCQHPVPTLGVDTYQSEYHLGRCQHPMSILGVNTYLKENAEWPTLIYNNFYDTPTCTFIVITIRPFNSASRATSVVTIAFASPCCDSCLRLPSLAVFAFRPFAPLLPLGRVLVRICSKIVL